MTSTTRTSLPFAISVRHVLGLFKLRIGVAIAFTALAGVAVSPGPALPAWKIALIGFAVLLSSAAAGAFN